MTEAWGCRPATETAPLETETETETQTQPRTAVLPESALPRRKPTTLRALLQPRQHAQRRDLERDQRFSWIHCLLSVFSYVLMLSDVPRTGFGVHDLSSYPLIEPEHLIFFGPYSYPVTTKLLKNETGSTSSSKSTANTPFWPYKYDSTSVAMRGVVAHLRIPEWPACVTYDAKCDESVGIPPATLFTMLDSLIERVKTHRDTQGRLGRITLRTHYDWADRIHSYAFPWFFSNAKLRTIQGIHYDLDHLRAAPRGSSLCSPTVRSLRPVTCDESSTNFERLCVDAHPLCADVSNVHAHVPARLHKLLETYPPDHKMDFILFGGVDDLSRSSLTFQGYKSVDVVALARIRKCVNSSTNSTATMHCETVMVDDFRYEVAALVTNVKEWFFVTAIIRGVGQIYAWLRLVFLLVGCYVARASEPRMQRRSYFRRAVLTVRTMFLLPSQVMVYGSLIPISCYLLAHLIDAAAVYEMMGLQLMTLMGVVSLELTEIIRICAVSMRSLWPLAFLCHVLHRVATHCAWSPIHGVPGIPEFSLSFVASFTILAQVRHPSLRDSRILSVQEPIVSSTRYQWNTMHSDTSHGFVYKLLFGTIIDYKCLAVAICLHISVVLLFRLLNHVIPRWFQYQSVLFTHTIVPYGARSLWSDSALVVSWHGTFLAKPPPKKAATRATTVLAAPLLSMGPKSDFHSTISEPVVAIRPLRDRPVAVHPTQPPRVVTAVSELTANSLHRSHDSETLIFLMNLGVMTDPFTFFQLRVLRGHCIGVFTEVATPPTGTSNTGGSSRTLLLPLALVTSPADIPIDWSELKLRFVVRTSELDWCDLLQCG